MIPMKGGDEMTLVQPEGVPTLNRDVVSIDAGMSVGRASGALLTGPTSQEGCRQTPQGESNDCQGRLIVTPATGATPSEAAHDGPGAAPVSLLLGVGACPGCGEELDGTEPCENCFCLYCDGLRVDGRCIDSSCEGSRFTPTGRDHRGWVRR